MPLNIAILASGSGSNAQAIIDKAAEGVLDVNVCWIICNRPGRGRYRACHKGGHWLAGTGDLNQSPLEVVPSLEHR